ncbi:MAG: hypothetical protein MHM6MM_000583 [Cercozoa sp. M6MM]
MPLTPPTCRAIDQNNMDGRTALMEAVASGNTAIFTLLMMFQPRTDIRDRAGLTIYELCKSSRRLLAMLRMHDDFELWAKTMHRYRQNKKRKPFYLRSQRECIHDYFLAACRTEVAHPE